MENKRFAAATTLLIALIAGFMLGKNAHAEDVTVSWTNPTANTDGTPIPATGAGALTGTLVIWGTCGATAGTFGVEQGRQLVAAPATTYVVTGLVPGTFCFYAQARNSYSVDSDRSNVASKVIVPPKPQPPTVTTVVTYVKTVYRVTSSGGIGAVVGSIPVGTQCAGAAPVRTWADGTQFWAVPRDYVTFTTPTPDPVVSKCRAA